MTTPSPEFQLIIGKALIDKDFRDLLYSDRDAALGGYQPSAEETQILNATSRETMDEYAEDVRQGAMDVCINWMTPNS